ncbi:hypothetical protein MNBD_UNCLBAC01-151, partial [hydrothermal vent metagenome]
MNRLSKQPHFSNIFRFIAVFIILAFTVTSISSPSIVSAQSTPTPIGISLPAVGQMLNLSPSFTPLTLKGIKLFPQEPLKFDFILDAGESSLEGDALEEESSKLIKYFMAALTVPEKDLWVNLSPYEGDRIIPNQFGETEMGRDLLAQDYLLKQLTATLMYPEDEIGEIFWNQVYEKAYDLYGTTAIPVNTFNKVWIIPEKAVVYENEDTAFIVESRLKVMLESDYLALEQNAHSEKFGTDHLSDDAVKELNDLSSEVVRNVIIPAIEQEINEGKNFAQLRQIYHSIILAAWFKRNLKESLLGQVYMDRNKIEGIDIADKQAKDKIYNQYVEAFKKGVYDYIREEFDPASQQIIPKRYFSGGAKFGFSNVNFGSDGAASPLKIIKKIFSSVRSKFLKGLFFTATVTVLCTSCGEKSTGLEEMSDQQRNNITQIQLINDLGIKVYDNKIHFTDQELKSIKNYFQTLRDDEAPFYQLTTRYLNGIYTVSFSSIQSNASIRDALAIASRNSKVVFVIIDDPIIGESLTGGNRERLVLTFDDYLKYEKSIQAVAKGLATIAVSRAYKISPKQFSKTLAHELVHIVDNSLRNISEFNGIDHGNRIAGMAENLYSQINRPSISMQKLHEITLPSGLKLNVDGFIQKMRNKFYLLKTNKLSLRFQGALTIQFRSDFFEYDEVTLGQIDSILKPYRFNINDAVRAHSFKTKKEMLATIGGEAMLDTEALFFRAASLMPHNPNLMKQIFLYAEIMTLLPSGRQIDMLPFFKMKKVLDPNTGNKQVTLEIQSRAQVIRNAQGKIVRIDHGPNSYSYDSSYAPEWKSFTSIDNLEINHRTKFVSGGDTVFQVNSNDNKIVAIDRITGERIVIGHSAYKIKSAQASTDGNLLLLSYSGQNFVELWKKVNGFWQKTDITMPKIDDDMRLMLVAEVKQHPNNTFSLLASTGEEVQINTYNSQGEIIAQNSFNAEPRENGLSKQFRFLNSNATDNILYIAENVRAGYDEDFKLQVDYHTQAIFRLDIYENTVENLLIPRDLLFNYEGSPEIDYIDQKT